MSKSHWVSRARRLGAIAVLIAPLISCDEDIEFDYKPTGVAAEVNAIRVTLGTQNVTVYKDGRVTLGPLAFIRPNTTITTTLLDDNDQPIQNVDPNLLQVNMGQENGSSFTITFTRTSPFAGTVASTTAGTSNFTFVLFDKVNRRNVFGPYFVAMVVR